MLHSFQGKKNTHLKLFPRNYFLKHLNIKDLNLSVLQYIAIGEMITQLINSVLTILTGLKTPDIQCRM